MIYYLYIKKKGVSPIYETKQDFIENPDGPTFGFEFADLERAQKAKAFIEGKKFKGSEDILNWIMEAKEVLTLHPKEIYIALPYRKKNIFDKIFKQITP